jgi:DNA-binding winged helix-turn-helix (wHTH) protein/TolB-like protein
MNANSSHINGDNGLKRNGEWIALADESDFYLGELLVRPSSREVLLGGQTEKLEPRVMQVLVLLARHRGEVISRELLVATCWEGRVVSDDALNRAMTKVRQWSKPATFTLETIPRVGYRLTAVEQSPKPSLAEPAAESTASTSSLRRYSTRKKILIGLGVMFALFFAFGAWMGFGLWQDSTRPFVAVLPLDVVGEDSRVANLADAVTTNINQRFADQGFRLVSPAVSAAYRGARKADAAEQLGARYLIDGSVRLQDERLRVTIRIDASVKPMTVWSREFDMQASDAHRLPERVSAVLAGLFNPTMQSSPMLPPEVAAGMMRINGLRFQSKDLDAYIAAKQFVREIPMHYTPQIWFASSVAEALDLLPPDQRTAALTAARTANETADQMLWGDLPTVYAGLTPTVDWAKREDILRTGLDDPYADGPTIRSMLSGLLAGSGRIDEALDFAKQANVMFPMSARIAVGYAGALETAGQQKQADAILERTAQSWPNVAFIERPRFASMIARGDFNAAAALLKDPEIGPLIDPPAEHQPIAALLRALTTPDASADIEQFERDCADPSKLARDRATLCLQGLIGLNRLDAFFEVASAYFPELRGTTAEERDARWLQAPRVGRYSRVLFRKDMQAVRADPRFIPIVERLGLVDYWRSSGKWPDFCKTEPQSVCDRMRVVQ